MGCWEQGEEKTDPGQGEGRRSLWFGTGTKELVKEEEDSAKVLLCPALLVEAGSGWGKDGGAGKERGEGQDLPYRSRSLLPSIRPKYVTFPPQVASGGDVLLCCPEPYEVAQATTVGGGPAPVTSGQGHLREVTQQLGLMSPGLISP